MNKSPTEGGVISRPGIEWKVDKKHKLVALLVTIESDDVRDEGKKLSFFVLFRILQKPD